MSGKKKKWSTLKKPRQQETVEPDLQRTEQNREEPTQSPQPKHHRLDQNNGQGLAKDTTSKPTIEAPLEAPTTVVPDTTEGTPLTEKLERGKRSLISESKVLAYREIPAIAHEFTKILPFGTSFELVEFLVMQQVTVAKRLAEEHAKRQMIQRAIDSHIELENENALSEIGRKRHTNGSHMAIELPTLNMALVKVHQELA